MLQSPQQHSSPSALSGSFATSCVPSSDLTTGYPRLPGKGARGSAEILDPQSTWLDHTYYQDAVRGFHKYSPEDYGVAIRPLSQALSQACDLVQAASTSVAAQQHLTANAAVQATSFLSTCAGLW